MFNLPWFIDLMFQVPKAILFWQHQTLLSPPDTSTDERHFSFGLTASFSLELYSCFPLLFPRSILDIFWPGGAHLLVSCIFVFWYSQWGSPSKYSEMSCHLLLLWITFFQNSSLWRIYLGWPCMARLVALLSYASPFSKTRLWSLKSIYNIYIIYIYEVF